VTTTSSDDDDDDDDDGRIRLVHRPRVAPSTRRSIGRSVFVQGGTRARGRERSIVAV